MLLVDDYSTMTLVTFIREKLEALDKFKAFKSMVENEIDDKIKCLRFDKGGVFTSNEFNKFCDDNGIRKHSPSLRTP